MKPIALALILAASAAGCTTTPEHSPGTERSGADQMAVVSVASDQVKIIETDGKPFPGSGKSDFYIQPGSHRFLVGLNWCPGGQCIPASAFADTPRVACIDATPGTRYRISAGNPGPDWMPRVTEQKSGGEARVIASRCS